MATAAEAAMTAGAAMVVATAAWGLRHDTTRAPGMFIFFVYLIITLMYTVRPMGPVFHPFNS